MSELHSGFCPNCGSKLRYESNASTVECYACDSTIQVAEITAKGGGSQIGASAPISVAAFAGFDNPESGVVFIENFFDTYDWEAYQLIPDIEIPEIAEVIANNKMKSGAIPETWYLDFKALYVPVAKKFEGLAGFEKDVVEKFNPIDPSEMLSAFDSYRLVARTLLKEKDAIIKVLSTAIKYAERFALKADRLSEIRKDLASIESKYATLATKTVVNKGEQKTVVVDKIEDFPAYELAKRAYAAKTAGEFAARGIDAQDVYERAIAAFKDGNVAAALPLFESIRAYSDSERYIEKLTQYFNYFNEVFRINGKYFVYKLEAYKESINIAPISVKGCSPLKKKKAAAEAAAAQAAADAEPATLALSLYPVIDGEIANISTVKGIQQVITTYGTKIFSIKAKKGIACCDINTGVETVIDSDINLYRRDSKGALEYGVAKHAPYIYVIKKYRETVTNFIKGGCLKKKQPNTMIKENTLNPYTLVLIDMSANSSRTVVTEMVDIKLRKDDKIFYNFAYKTEKAPVAKKGCMSFFKKAAPVAEEKPKIRLMVCDLDNGTTTQALDDDCDIKAVKGDNVIYTHWKPNDLNQDLHVYNMASGEDVLVEDNIYDYFDLIDDKIYYTIGNKDFRPLVRANLDGSEREQIMRNIVKIVGVRGGWFYVTKGYGYNNLLQKVKVDGSKTVNLIYGYKEINRFEGNLVYYVDLEDNLRAVRIDGKENRLIAEKVKKVFPAEDGLYYCREEAVARRESALSLYHMDKDGKNIKKIIFNVDRVQDDAITNTLYYSKKENVQYKVYEQGKESEARFQNFPITKYYSIKKAEAGMPAEKPVLYLVVGAPKSEAPLAAPTGCLAKFKKQTGPMPLVYEEAPIVHSYANRGLTDEEINEQNGLTDGNNAGNELENKLPSWMPASLKSKIAGLGGAAKNSPAAAGCSKGCGQGCSPKK